MARNKSNKQNKANIESQSVDTNTTVIKQGDTRPYEQKNMPDGAFKPNKGSK